MSDSNDEKMVTPSPSPASSPRLRRNNSNNSNRAYYTNEESYDRQMNEQLSPRAAIAANAAIEPVAAHAIVEALANEMVANAPAVAAANAPAEPVVAAAPEAAALDHPAARLMESPRFIAKIFEQIVLSGNIACMTHPNAQYDPSSITLIGGAVLTIYDHLIANYRARKGGRLLRLREYIQDATRDMDIVWNMTNAPHLIQSNPVLVRTLGTLIVEQLQTDDVKDVITGLIRNELQQDVNVRIHNIDSTGQYGTFAIHIEVETQGYPSFTICDFSIHDGYSSQQYDDNHVSLRNGRGKLIHRPAGMDPTYCDRFNSLLFQIDRSYICIPQMGRFIYQQLYAFGNLALHNDPRRWPTSMKNLKRILYLIRVLSVVNTKSVANTADLGQLILSQDLNLPLYLNHIFMDLNMKINMILFNNRTKELKDSIIAVLHHFNFNNASMEVLGKSSVPIQRTIQRLEMEQGQRAHIHIPAPVRKMPSNTSRRQGGKNKRKTRKRN